MKIRYGLRYYNLITSYEEIEGKQFPIWHPNNFYAKDLKEVKFLMNITGIKYKSDNIAVLIDEVDASDIIGELGQMLREFNIRDN